MISKSVLTSAKAFLCWDVFKNLSVQLVPVHNAVAYYYPPQNAHHGIVLFYTPGAPDLCEPLFLLFHEAGHARQWAELCAQNRKDYFQEMIDRDKGTEKMTFEKEAWDTGRRLLEQFLRKEQLDATVLAKYDLYGKACLLSYSE